MNVSSLIDQIPQWLFILLYSVPPLLLMWLVHLGFQKFAPHWELKDRDENMASGGVASVAALTGVVLAFVLALANQAIDTYQNNVSIEASQLRSMDKFLLATQAPDSLQCRQSLLTYANSIVNDEWPQLKFQKGSIKTYTLLSAFEKCLISVQPTTPAQASIYIETLKLSNQIAESRETRISNSANVLSNVFWEVIHIGLLLTIILAALSFYTPGKIRVINCTIQIIALSILIALVMLLDHPFTGTNNVSNAAIIETIAHIKP